MQAHDLKPPKGATHARKRIGRGNASGHGTYSGRGLKGQKARNKVRREFEGGQTRLMRRLPRRRGFTNYTRKEYQPVNLRELGRFEAGTEVTAETLKEAGVIDSAKKPVKILGVGEITVKLTVRANRFSMTAKEKITAAGGTIDEMDERKAKRQRKVKKKKGAQPQAQAGEGKGEGKAEKEAPEAEAEAAEAPAEGGESE
jgi:large subunit ribosomal protein L15